MYLNTIKEVEKRATEIGHQRIKEIELQREQLAKNLALVEIGETQGFSAEQLQALKKKAADKKSTSDSKLAEETQQRLKELPDGPEREALAAKAPI